MTSRTTRARRVSVILLAGTLAAYSDDAAQRPQPSEQSQTPPPVTAPISPSVTSADVLPPDQVRKSQPGAIAQRVATTEITITYSRPVARGRVLFGNDARVELTALPSFGDGDEGSTIPPGSRARPCRAP